MYLSGLLPPWTWSSRGGGVQAGKFRGAARASGGGRGAYWSAASPRLPRVAAQTAPAPPGQESSHTKAWVLLETIGPLPTALTHPVLSVGMCRAQRAPQPQAAFLSDRLSSLDQLWVKVGLHLPTQGPLSLSPSPQTLLWEAVSAGDPCNVSTGLGNGCWMHSRPWAHTQLWPRHPRGKDT